ncbi:hypothetical protein JTE90_005933 [Oedothorax gibbosus]|uniref:Uncharacterized protein n=1 Tax=Oedothorax gibbosus TaxID=931172 RepID=A0AAV6UAV3_9ARAC|nr:hypothetical protein JTE90_005933 [Oedothorax gibbosus]
MWTLSCQLCCTSIVKAPVGRSFNHPQYNPNHRPLAVGINRCRSNVLGLVVLNPVLVILKYNTMKDHFFQMIFDQ